MIRDPEKYAAKIREYVINHGSGTLSPNPEPCALNRYAITPNPKPETRTSAQEYLSPSPGVLLVADFDLNDEDKESSDSAEEEDMSDEEEEDAAGKMDDI